MSEHRIVVDLSAVVLTVVEDTPLVLVVERGGRPALPAGDLTGRDDRTLDRAVRRWVWEQTGLSMGFVEQLYTFGDLDRDQVATDASIRHLTVSYVAFVPDTGGVGSWRDLYEFFPWEDRRTRVALPGLGEALGAWVSASPDDEGRAERDERVVTTFATQGGAWDPVRVLERYELLYEAGLVAEGAGGRPGVGLPAYLDHRRILAAALGRVRGKLTYRPVVFELLPDTFTLWQLQQVVEALAGAALHKQNFRRLVEGGGLVEPTGDHVTGTGGRPAALFRFRREVLRERPAPGVGLPRPR